MLASIRAASACAVNHRCAVASIARLVAAIWSLVVDACAGSGRQQTERADARNRDEAGHVETRQPGVNVVLRHTDAALDVRPRATGSAHECRT